jgi:hypothetical protein
MVLLEIDPASVAVFEFERDAPRSVDVNRIALWIEAMQRMKVEAWNVHFLRPHGDVETVESREKPFVHFRINLRTPALRPQLRKGFALEGPDHT